MSKPKNFMIYIRSQSEFQTTWDGLVALGYEVAHSDTERQYEGPGTVIKHNSTLGYIWSSRIIDHSKQSYHNFEVFCAINELTPVVQKAATAATMNDAIRAVELDQELGDLQAEEEYRVGEVNTLRERIATKLNELKALKEKLGITA